MTRYTVVWDPDVKSQFIADWIEAGSQVRDILTELANFVDATLAEDPERKGEARDDLGVRVLTMRAANSGGRIAVTYRVFPDDRLVQISLLSIRGT